MISRIFIERPKLSFVISIVTVIAGVLCLFQVPVAEYPEIAPPQIMVSASYPGASAEVIAETVATVIESEANGIEDMIYFSSQSNNSGSYQLSITFKPGTDTDIAQVNVQNAVSRAEPSLPAEVKALGVQVKKRSSDILGMYAFTTDGTEVSQLELSNYVRIHVKDELARIDGISDVAIWGERNYSMRVWLDPMRMSALKIKPEDVISAIESQNVQAAAGTHGHPEVRRREDHRRGGVPVDQGQVSREDRHSLALRFVRPVPPGRSERRGVLRHASCVVPGTQREQRMQERNLMQSRTNM